MNTRNIGTHYEEAAIEYLKSQGITIIDRNVVCGKVGEIDIIGREADKGKDEVHTLIFFEVKYRKNTKYGYAAQAVNASKQNKIRRCAEYYLAYRNTDDYIRFDVLAIDGEEISWYKNAF